MASLQYIYSPLGAAAYILNITGLLHEKVQFYILTRTILRHHGTVRT